VASVQHPRPRVSSAGRARGPYRQLPHPGRRRHRGRNFAAGAITLSLLLLAGAAIALISARGTLAVDQSALASIAEPLGGGRIESVSVVTGPHSQPVPVVVRGHQIWPRGLIATDQPLSIQVVVKRPGWISWLTGSTERLSISLRTPNSPPVPQYVTLRSGAPLRLSFKQPVAVLASGALGALHRRVLGTPAKAITLDTQGAGAGSTWVAVAPRVWETGHAALVSWFPAGATTSAVAIPSPGTPIRANAPIMLRFSKPVAQALGGVRPPVSPATPGSWHTVDSHTIVFQPQGYGYGLGARVSVGLPNGVRLLGGRQGGASESGTWTVPPGSTLRLQQLLAQLGYLPLDFHPSGAPVALTPQAQEAAAVAPPAGSFAWRYSNVPAALRGFWQPGASGEMTRGALMAFENDRGLTADGIAGPQVWRSLLSAALSGHRASFGYTFVSVDEGSQRLSLWHNGQTVVSTPVNTGIASAPTATGTYAVYEHISSGTMSGTNPDGSHYHDPGVPWISYFNGGDALHGFTRAQYGFPQSLGCVEMPVGAAGQVWPYTPIGTLVHIT
jgi:peptidoglycan hydrolase-like protein with peptidoglycan-binding domain